MNLKRPNAAIVGMGQLGRVLGEGLLCSGWTVTAFRRHERDYDSVNPVDMAVIATGEDDLGQELSSVPSSWLNSKTVLLQNELLPTQWESRSVVDPTIFIVWFSKKPGEVIREYRPSLLHGPLSKEISIAMNSVGVKTELLENNSELITALVVKNTYIWAQNIVSIALKDPLASSVLAKYRGVLDSVIDEVISVQESSIGQSLDRSLIIKEVIEVISKDADKKLGGRVARARLERLVKLATSIDVAVPTLFEIKARLSPL